MAHPKLSWKHLHIVIVQGDVQPIDPWATFLALTSAGRRVLAGTECLGQRTKLALCMDGEELDGLAQLLVSARPILVNSFAGGYLFWEL